MADDPTINNDEIKQVTGSFNALNAGIISARHNTDKLATSFDAVVKSLSGIGKRLSPIIKDVGDFEEAASKATEGLEELDTAYAAAFYQGNKQMMVAMQAMRGTGLAIETAARNAKILTDEINKQSANFREHIDVMNKNKDLYEELQKRQKDLRAELKGLTGDTAEHIEMRAKLNAEFTANEGTLKEYKVAEEAAKKEADGLLKSIQATTLSLKKEEEEFVKNTKAVLDNAAAERQFNRDLRKAEGGLSGIKAHFGDIVDSKIFEYLKKASTLALVAASFYALTKVLSQTADHAKAVSRVALTLGDTSQRGFKRLAESGREAGKTIAALQEASADLGFAMEDLEGAMNKIRAGIRMDKEGQLSENAIRGMTREAAMFARVSGMELADTVALLETRIKRYGMTADEATANLQNMRNTITQMTAGNKNNTIAMGDMVNIIEEASAASQSYIVDTRIMTQALRGAVNQAENLGAAQAQAKDVAKATGKILSGAPDYIKIPAGFDLVNQLMGGDADNLINTLDGNVRKQVIAIQSALKGGELGRYAGAKALMDLIGQTEAGIEVQSAHLEKTLLKGKNASILIAQEYHIDNMATAQMITDMMKQTMKMRDRLKDENGKPMITFATALVKNTGDFNAAMENAALDKDAIKKVMDDKGVDEAAAKLAVQKDALAKKGLSPKQIEEYFALYTAGENAVAEKRKRLKELQDKYDIDSMREKGDLEAKIYEETVLKQTNLLQKQLDPLKDITKRLGKGGAWDIEATITAEDFESAGIKTAEALAGELGVDYKSNKDVMDRIWKDGIKSKDLQGVKDKLDKTAADQKAATEAFQNLLVTPLESVKFFVTKGLALWNKQSQWTKLIMTGLGILSAALVLWKGQKALFSWAVDKMEHPIGKGAYAAIKDAGLVQSTGKGNGGKSGESGTKNKYETRHDHMLKSKDLSPAERDALRKEMKQNRVEMGKYNKVLSRTTKVGAGVAGAGVALATVNALVGSFYDLDDASNKNVKSMLDLSGKVANTAMGVGGLVATVAQTWPMLAKFGGWIGKTFPALAKFGSAIFESAIKPLGALASSLLTKVGSALLAFSTSIWTNAIKPLGVFAWSLLSRAVGAIGTFALSVLTTVVPPLITFALGLWGAIVPLLPFAGIALLVGAAIAAVGVGLWWLQKKFNIFGKAWDWITDKLSYFGIGSKDKKKEEKHHTGGIIDGSKGSEKPATLQAGEFVLRKEAVNAIGVPTLSEMNTNPQSALGKASPMSPVANTANLAGMRTSMPEVKAAPSPVGNKFSSKGGGANAGIGSLHSRVNAQSLSPDGSLILKVHGFNDILGKFLQDRRNTMGARS